MGRRTAQCSNLLALGVVFCAPSAKAIVNININEFSYGVRIEGSGSLDLSALHYQQAVTPAAILIQAQEW